VISQWHRECKSRKAGSYNFRTDSYKFRKGKIMGDQKFQFAPKWKIISAKKPKMSQSCAKVALHGKNWAVARKREICAKVALRNIAFFWGGGYYNPIGLPLEPSWRVLTNDSCRTGSIRKEQMRTGSLNSLPGSDTINICSIESRNDTQLSAHTSVPSVPENNTSTSQTDGQHAVEIPRSA